MASKKKSKKISTSIKKAAKKKPAKKRTVQKVQEDISIQSASVEDFQVSIMASASVPVSADWQSSYNDREAERGKFVVADTTHAAYDGYPGGRGKYDILTYQVNSLGAVDFSESYNDREAERGKFVKLDMDTATTGYPANGRGKYAVLTYCVNATSPTVVSSADIPSGVNTLRVDGLSLDSNWSQVFVSVRVPAGGGIITAAVSAQEPSSSEFTALFTGTTPNADYKLDYQVF